MGAGERKQFSNRIISVNVDSNSIMNTLEPACTRPAAGSRQSAIGKLFSFFLNFPPKIFIHMLDGKVESKSRKTTGRCGEEGNRGDFRDHEKKKKTRRRAGSREILGAPT